MSYVVSIKRESAPIAQSEFESMLEGISGFRKEGSDVLWQAADPKSKKNYFVLEESGVISVNTPSNAGLRAMQELAKPLRARVIGEEGEDLTDVEVPEGEASLLGCATVIVVLSAVGYFLWWLFS